MVAFNQFARKLRQLVALPVPMQGWLPLTWLLLGISRAAILTLSFRRLAPRLGRLVPEGASEIVVLEPEQERLAVRLRRLVTIAAHHTPWRSNCFAQALTARVLLGIHGVPFSLFLGVARDKESAGLRAHAWVVAGRVPVTGGPSFDRYKVLARFSPHLPGI